MNIGETIFYCPHCAMPHSGKAAFDKPSQSYAVECDSCYACGPRETSSYTARVSYLRRAHDVEWAYKKGVKIASRFCVAIGQKDVSALDGLAKEIGQELLADKPDHQSRNS